MVGIIAGGEKAFTEAIEGSEDNIEMGKEDLEKIGLTKNDVVVGLAASGRTPYVIGALEYANSIQAPTVAIACTRESEIGQVANIAIELRPAQKY